MRTKRAEAFFLAGTVRLPIATYAADSDKDCSSPREYVRDSVIATEIKAKLAEEKVK